MNTLLYLEIYKMNNNIVKKYILFEKKKLQIEKRNL